jgi:hypothetical protein
MEKSSAPNVLVSSTVDPEPEINYPKGIELAVIITSLAASVFLCALVRKQKAGLIIVVVHSVVLIFSQDETIIATAIPKITDDLKALNAIGWYRSA